MEREATFAERDEVQGAKRTVDEEYIERLVQPSAYIPRFSVQRWRVHSAACCTVRNRT